MSESDHQPVDVSELHDRLLDTALAEVVGGKTPPDLSTRILEAERVSPSTPPYSPAKLRPFGRRRRYWIEAAVAVSVMLVIAALMLPSLESPRETARPAPTSAAAKTEPTHEPADMAMDWESLPPVQLETVLPSDDSRRVPGFYAESGPTNEVREYLESELSSAPPEAVGLDGLINDADGPANAPATKKPSVYYLDPAYEAPGQALAASSPSSQSNTWGYHGVPGGGSVWPQRELRLKYRSNSWFYVDSVNETDEGTGPGLSGDQYTRIFENPFVKAMGGDAVSTFSIDVDTASYANVRKFLQMNQLPPPDAVRIEELINYFHYDYAPPAEGDEAPFAAHVEVAGCPWTPEHRLVRIGIKGREMDAHKRPPSNLVFLVDVSGSMDEPQKLPLVVDGLRQLARELGENDRVAIVVYASSEGLALPSTTGDKQETILGALNRLRAGGSTAGGAGIQLAYQIAEDNFITGGTNRVVLCTDGDFNVGVTSTAELERMVEQKAKDTGVFLSVLGFGRGNLNDAMMETISNHGNGNYHYVDNQREARKVLVEEMTGTLVTIAKDVKIQVEFNPATVAGYRLLGYENRMLRTEDFNDDTKDAGEIGAGHTVTALYEIVPAGKPVDVPPVDDLKYQEQPTEAAASDELLTLKMRYKAPDGDTSKKLEWPVTDEGHSFTEATGDLQFATAVAGFGLLLRDSQYKGNLTHDAVVELAEAGVGADTHGYRRELVDLVRRAKSLSGR